MRVPRWLIASIPATLLLLLVLSLFSPEKQPSPQVAVLPLSEVSAASPELRTPVQEIKQKAAETLSARVPGVHVDFDPGLGTPHFIASTESFLTGPGGRGLAMSDNAPGGDAPEIVRAFLDRHSALFGHGAEVLDGARTARDYVTEHSQLRTMVWQQQHGDIRIFEATLQAHVTSRGELVNIASRLLPGPDTAAVRTVRKVNAAEAVRATALSLGDPLEEKDIIAATAAQGAEEQQGFDAHPLLTEASAQLVWLPQDAQTMRLCWEVISVSRRTGWMHRTLVDAETGVVSRQMSLTEAISPASYRVFTGDSPTPLSPGHSTPLNSQPPEVSRELVTITALNLTSSPNGWINDGGNETLGNNVDAHLDLNADNLADTPRPQGSPARFFDTQLNLTLYPSAYRSASVVNLFYWNNVMHDRLYELGFTEAAGNFQTANFGRGGLGNDAVRADAQDGLDTNNANFSTPPDGSPPRMQMFLYDGTSSMRDSCFDAEIILHEYTHGLSNRLVGGGTGINALQSRGMGEGWSDFYALSILSEPTDNPAGTYAKGAYAAWLIEPRFNANYYYGVRRYPYCTDMQKNPLTFRDIDPNQAGSHFGVPLSPVPSSSATSVHNIGEVWCMMLWEARAALIAKLGPVAGNTMMLRLTTDGMKLAPANPNFIQARDAILQADQVLNAGANRPQLWTAFAKRGMGSGASAPFSSTTTGVVESALVPDPMSVSPGGDWTPSVMSGNFNAAPKTWTVSNTGNTPLTWNVNAGGVSWLAASPQGGTLAAGASTTVTISLTIEAAQLSAGSYSATVRFTNVSSGLQLSRPVSLTVEPMVNLMFEETWESGAAGSAWTISGTGPHRTEVTVQNWPHAGNYHLSMDSTGTGFARNEATLTLNLTGRRDLQLSFWLKTFSDEPNAPPSSPFTGGADFDGVAISTNGTTWHEILPLRTSASDWTKFTVNLDAELASRGLTYGPNFRIRFNHYDDYTIPTDGFALDDIRLVEVVPRQLRLRLPERVREGDAPVTATLEVIPVPLSALTIPLTTSRPDEIGIPASVSVPAGTGSVTFSVTIADDGGLDGTQTATISAESLTYRTGEAALPVDDNETAVLTLSLQAAAAEGSGGINGLVQTDAPVTRDTPVTLTSSDPAKLAAPAQVIIPAGESAASVVCQVLEDSIIDGTQMVTLTAAVPYWRTGSATVEISDNEFSLLALTLPPAVTEGLPPLQGRVEASGRLTAPLTVTLLADDRSQLEVPASVVIPAGETGVSFPVAAVDDGDADGAWLFGILATAPGFGDATAPVQVNDDDAHHFSLSPVGTAQTPGRAFTLIITAMDVNEAVLTTFHAPVNLRAVDGAGNSIAVAPAAATGWTNGVWTGQVKVGAPGTGIVLTADDGAGHTGSSNPFDAVIGPLHHFNLGTVTSPQYHDAPIALTIRAVDEVGNTVPDFNGTAALTAHETFGTAITLPFLPQGPLNFTAGTWSGSVVIPFLHTGIKLRATAGSFTGQTAVFTVEAPPAIAPATVLRDAFDSATARNWWSFSGTGAWRTEITAMHGPSSAPYHMLLDSSQTDSFSRNEATLTLDLAGRTGVVLNYKVKSLGDDTHNPAWGVTTPGGNFDAVLISRDGVTWFPVAQLSWFPDAWNVHSLPLDEFMTQRGWSYNSTFKVRFNQYDDRPAPEDGLAFDDIVITANPRPALTLQLPAGAIEGGPVQSGTVTLPAAAAEDTVISLSSTAPAKLAVPASVTIPTGQTSATFPLMPGDDTYVDGDKTVYINAAPPAGDPARAPVLITDDEITSFTLTVSSFPREGGTANVNITLPQPAFAPVTIKLISSDPAQFTVPPAITILAHEQYATAYQCVVVDDNWVEGPHSVTLTAVREGIPGASVSINVPITDYDSDYLEFTGASAGLDEGQSATLTLKLRGVALHPVPVTISNYLPDRFTGPAEVIIPAGAGTATFTVTAPQNSVPEGNRTYQLSARTPWSYTEYLNVPVREDDPAGFRLDSVPPQTFGGFPQQTAGLPFPVRIQAYTGWSGPPAAAFHGQVSLVAAGSNGPLTVTPAVAGPFISGVWTGMVTITPSSPGVTLHASAGGINSSSNVFDVFSAPLHHFDISTVSSPQRPWEPFTVTITAMDALNNVLTGYTDPVQLTFATPFASTPYRSFPIASNPALPTGVKFRMQVLYLQSEFGGMRKMKAMRCGGSLPSVPINNWTVRLRKTPQTSLTASWDAGPWTTVYSGPAIHSGVGIASAIQFPFSRSFELDGTGNLLVDLSYELTATGSSGVFYATGAETWRRLVAGTSSASALPPAQWTGSGSASVPTPFRSDVIPRMEFVADHPPLALTGTGSFNAGRWTGPVTVNGSGNGLSLLASTGYISSSGSSFNVASAVATDTDGDRLPDTWETASNLDPGSSSGDHGTYGDPDSDGLANFIELALGLPPRTPNPDAAPRAAVQINPSDSLAYLTVTWRRPAVTPYAFTLESSADGRTWSSAASGFQNVSVTPDASGLTETVVTRLLPAADAASLRRLVRLRVTAP